MAINWSQVAGVGLKVASLIIPQIGTVEQIAKSLPTLKGQQKEDAVVAAAKQALEGVETVAGKELLSDPAFDVAARQFIQGYVAIQNLVNTKPASTQN